MLTYADVWQYVAANGLPSLFRGVNHVFDQRLGQRVGSEVLVHAALSF